MCTGKETTLEDLALIIKRLLRCKSARGHGMRVWAWRIFTLAASRNDDDAHLYIYIYVIHTHTEREREREREREVAGERESSLLKRDTSPVVKATHTH